MITGAAALKRWFGRATEPHILYPVLGAFVLTVVWGTTLDFIDAQRSAAERAAASSSRELAGTYEAQVVRALREIDQTLKVVKYAYETQDKKALLQDLKARGLLPPELLFEIRIADKAGRIVAGARSPENMDVGSADYFLAQRQGDTFAVGHSEKTTNSGDWILRFSRRLNSADGSFAGIAMVSVDAGYFVSGYEASTMGEHGALGILGTDGVFRVWRSGEKVSAGESVNYSSIVPPNDQTGTDSMPVTNPWDSVQRYTTARKLYDFPLAVIVGLSADEQLAEARRDTRTYLLRATAGSLVAIVLLTTLALMSRELAAARKRVVEEQIAHSARVEYLANHDGLTTLPNRSLFSKLLGQSISNAQRHDRHLAVLFLDLDHFKEVNDTLGHEAGDELLRDVATRLRTCLRDGDTVARLGGDEFVVLLPELDVQEHAASVARKILSAIAQPFVLLGHDFRITASIGICTYPQDGLDEQTLTKNADMAMYKAKEEGKNNFRFYSERLNAASLERLTLESGLRHALEQGEFQLHYQAKYEIRSGMITGLEALLRWQHPDLGTVAPMRFIPVAEETGLIVPIGKWVLRTACGQNVAWQRQGLPHLTMAINLAPRQFLDERLLTDLAAILVDTGMDPRLLELEIGESLLMRDVENNLRILTGLKDMGVRIAIDNFGIGYSSLSTLRQFPIDTIKIDRSFIRDIASVSADKDVAGAIIAMGRTLSMTVVAQGVETRDQADFLRRNACDELQGFYFNKPVPAEEMAEFLRTPPEVAQTNAFVQTGA